MPPASPAFSGSPNIPSPSSNNTPHASAPHASTMSVECEANQPRDQVRAEVVAILSDMANNCLHELGYYYGMPQDLQAAKTELQAVKAKLAEAESFIYMSKQKDAQQRDNQLNNARALLQSNPSAQQVFDLQQSVARLQENNTRLYQDNRVLVATMQKATDAQSAAAMDQDAVLLHQKLQKYRQKIKDLENAVGQAQLTIQQQHSELQKKNHDLVALSQQCRALTSSHERALSELRQHRGSQTQGRRVSAPLMLPVDPLAPKDTVHDTNSNHGSGRPTSAASSSRHQQDTTQRDISPNTRFNVYPTPPSTAVCPPDAGIPISRIHRTVSPPQQVPTSPASLQPGQRSVTHPPVLQVHPQIIKLDTGHASSPPEAVHRTPPPPSPSQSYLIDFTPDQHITTVCEELASDMSTAQLLPADGSTAGAAPEDPAQSSDAPSVDVKMEPQAPVPLSASTNLSPPPAVSIPGPSTLSPSGDTVPQAMVTEPTATWEGVDTEDVEMQAADGEEDDVDDDDDEEGPLRLDSEGLRVVEDCLEQLFEEDDNKPGSRECMLCRHRIVARVIEQPMIFVNATEKELVDHCVAQHPTAWERVRQP